MEFRYEEDLIQTAKDYNYDSWQQLLIDKYEELQSTRLVGKEFNRTGQWANDTLKKLNVNLRKPGGKVYSKWQGKQILCKRCQKRYVKVKGLCESCYNREWFLRSRSRFETSDENRMAV
jgi:hypothetical protein